ncbi:MAG TPA: hypothetical protein VG125_07010 [Pirellulales bacterium]|jgi:hypothetical protein|nr:hypothetical protein [Pirellulales bacterium]
MNPRKSFLLRIEPGLYHELECWAQQELRSVNGQIEYLLTQAVARRKRGKASADADAVETHRPQAASAADLASGVARPADDG